ncbi:MAG: recombinase family protein [Fimbriimonadaceae bacterium]|nr:recombinase family protein [Fimbriimonadaceae bacterium]
MPHKIGFYIRVSTEEQAMRTEGSLESQKHRLASFVDLRNMQTPNWGVVVKNYIDDGHSAKDTNRPALQKLITDLRKGTINMVLVVDLSRLSRSIRDFCGLLDLFKDTSSKFLSLKEQFDTSTAAGEMMLFNMINLAQFERRQISERVTLNFHSRAMRGLRNGGVAPLGFKVNPDNKSVLVIDDAEAGYVRQIFDLFLIEGSLYRTAAKLREQNVPCRPNDNEKNERNQIWNVQNLASVLRSYHYAGLREVNKQHKNKSQADLAHHEKYQVVKAAWSGIIPETTFFAVQKVLDDNQKLERVRRNGSAKRNFLLTGVAYCQECGRPLVGSTGHGGGGEVQYYLHRPIEGKPVTCEVKRFRAEIAESAIENHFLRVVLREGYLDGLAQELEKNFKSLHKDKMAERISLEQKIVHADKDLTRLIKLQMQTDDDDLRELYSDQLKIMKDQRKADTEAVEAAKEAESSIVDPVAFKNAIEFNMRSLQKAWDKASPSLRKKLLRAVVDRLEFRPDGIDIHYYPVQANLLTVQSNQSSESTGAEPVDLASFRKSKEKQKADIAASHAGLSDNAKVFRWYIVGSGCGGRI